MKKGLDKHVPSRVKNEKRVWKYPGKRGGEIPQGAPPIVDTILFLEGRGMIMKKKLVCCCLLILTILAVSSTTFAAAYVAKIGNQRYTSLNKAVNDVRSGGTIKLLRNTSWSYTEDKGLEGKKFTMDLANHVLTLKKLVHLGGGTNIKIKNGTIKGNHKDGVPCFEVGTYAYQKDKRRSKITFQKCKIKMLKRGLFIETNLKADIVMKNSDLSFAKADDRTAFEIGEGSTLTVTGGNWSSGQDNQSIIDSNGSVKISKLKYKGNPLLHIMSGKAEITSGTYYKIPYYSRDLITVSGGKLTISGGSFTSESQGLICMSSGTMTMTGGKLRNIQIPVNNTYTAPSVSESGYHSPGHSGPVCILFEVYGDEKTVVNLNGGKVISDHGCCIYRRAEANAVINIGKATCTPLAGAPVTFIYSYTA